MVTSIFILLSIFNSSIIKYKIGQADVKLLSKTNLQNTVSVVIFHTLVQSAYTAHGLSSAHSFLAFCYPHRYRSQFNYLVSHKRHELNIKVPVKDGHNFHPETALLNFD